MQKIFWQCFLEIIKGMSAKSAYEYYKNSKFKGAYNTEETKKEFSLMNKKRCSFCTKYISDFNSEMTIEHIILKKDVPEKIFSWTNMLCACRTCNTKRSTKKYEPEKYIDPSVDDDVEKYFEFKTDGSILPSESLNSFDRKRAQYMIKMYELNRADLKYDRKKFLLDLFDDTYYNILCNSKADSQKIIFLNVFVYAKRRKKDGR